MAPAHLSANATTTGMARTSGGVMGRPGGPPHVTPRPHLRSGTVPATTTTTTTKRATTVVGRAFFSQFREGQGERNGAGDGYDYGSSGAFPAVGSGAGEAGKKSVGWAPGLTDLPSRESLQSYIQGSGGPPRVFSPLPPNHLERNPADLPLLIVLPGIDGTGYTAAAQFPGLSERFDLKTFLIPVNDRTPLDGLVQILREYIESEVAHSPEDRPIYVMGESFGGILALLLADACGHLCLNRVCLVNPATSFDKSIWSQLGDVLPSLPAPAYEVLPFAISPLLGNPLSLARRRVDSDQPLPSQAVQTVSSLFALMPVLDNLKDILPPETLRWKLQLLAEGAARVDDALLSSLQQRVLVVAGDADLLIPSKDESDRLKNALRTCSVKVVEGAGHALLQEADVDINAIFDEMGFYAPKIKYTSPKPVKRALKKPQKKAPSGNNGSGSGGNGRGGLGNGNGNGNGEASSGSEKVLLNQDNARSIELPTLGELAKVCDDIGLTRAKQLVSPVFFSTSPDNEVVTGLEHLPKGRPLIIVCNHQTLALDLGFLISGLLEEGGILARGLAHPSLFQDQSSTNAGMRGLFTNFGAVPVTPRNMFKLLKNEEVVLLFPGGAREALKQKGEDYQLFWPEEQEFVRIAAKFGATIVPLSGVGIDDSVDIIASSQELLDFPLVGDFLKQSIENVQTVREDETLVFPLTRPRTLNRLYFKFGRPIELAEAGPGLVSDKEACEEIYQQAKQEVEGGIAYLKKKREQDPYKDIIPRVLYERNAKRKAPTFNTNY